MPAALKIIVNVAVFRLKKLEMANMFAAVAIMLALRLDWDDMALRFGFGLLLNLLAYLTNDYCDVDQDLASPNKNTKSVRFLKEHMGAALGAQIGLAVVLAGIAIWWSPGLLVALVAGAGICWVYSWKLKRLPYVDVLAMITWGAAMPLVGVPLDSALGWILLGQLALFSACFESIQVIREGGTKSLRYMKPIVIKQPCMMCHGQVGEIDDTVLDSIHTKYPGDQAIGYKVGDLRGAFTVIVDL